MSEASNIRLEATYDPGWAYCPQCNSSADDYNLPNCAFCAHRSTLPIPTTLPRPVIHSTGK